MMGNNLMKLVETDYALLLEMAHRRWINERTAETSDAFDRALLAAISHDARNLRHSADEPSRG